jgi:hypothetical protein
MPSARWFNNMQRLKNGATLAAVLALAGCATPPPDVQPVLNVLQDSCPASPALGGAVETVSTIDGDSEKPATATLDLQSPCVTTTDGKALYAVFGLPDGGPYTIRVSSVPQGSSILAPRAVVLDGNGQVMREVPVTSFMFRGATFAALYRSHPGERYLVVRSDVASAGKPLSRVMERTRETVASTGYATFIIYTGSDLPMNTTWSLNGKVLVSVVADKPKKN